MSTEERISEKTIVPVGEAIEILTHVLMQAHHMNPEDKPENVRHAKSKYVRSQIIRLNEARKIGGYLEYYDCSDEGVDGVTTECDRIINELPHKLNMYASTVNIKKLVEELIHQMESACHAVPEDLKTFLNTDKGDNVKPQKPVNEKMSKLAIKAHTPLNKAKERIREYVRIESNRVEGDKKCTCMHSQFFRYTSDEVKKGNPDVRLEYKPGKKISENNLRKLVIAEFDTNRIQTKNMVLQKCVFHGLNN